MKQANIKSNKTVCYLVKTLNLLIQKIDGVNMILGRGNIVEIDECLFSKRRFDVARLVERKLIVICIDKNT